MREWQLWGCVFVAAVSALGSSPEAARAVPEEGGGGDALGAVLRDARARADRADTRRTIERHIGPNGAVAVRDTASGVGLVATLIGSGGRRHAEGSDVVLEGALGPGTRRVVEDVGRGLEDWIAFEGAPATESVRYRVDTDGAAGVRFVARTLELLDASGAPRIRMAPPWLVDATGARIDVAVRVTGCAFDTDPRAPFRRAAVAPGAACDVELSWAGTGARYPIAVDPTWSATDSLMAARREMAIGRLADDTVLVAGGIGPGPFNTVPALASAELFDPVSETFAAAMSLPVARGRPWFGTLADGRLVVGGGAIDGLSAPVAGALAFSSTTGAWATLAAPTTARVWAESVVLADGTMLVVGGKTASYFASAAVGTAERYDPVANAWSGAGTLGVARYGNFVLTPLASGRVLAAGGWDGVSTTHASAELWDPGTNAWTPTGSLAVGRGTGLFGVLPSGLVVVAGGSTNVAGVITTTATTETYDPASGTWTPAGPIGAPVDYRSNGALAWPDGTIVAPAGIGPRGLYSERFDPGTRTWQTGCDPGRTYLVAIGSVLLADGRALVVGGVDTTGVVASAWLSGQESGACDDGNPCTDDACVPASGCTFAANTSTCDDGDGCTSGDVCAASACAGTVVAGCGDAGTDAGSDAGRDGGTDAATTSDSGTDAATLAIDSGARDASGGPADASAPPSASAGGCCSVIGERPGAGAVLGIAVALAALGARRHRRRR